MRRSLVYLSIIALCLGLFLALPLHARYAQEKESEAQRRRSGAPWDLPVTDLCLVTEARYTRHPAMADHHAPFQEHPLALEHFPSGALLLPPGLRGDQR